MCNTILMLVRKSRCLLFRNDERNVKRDRQTTLGFLKSVALERRVFLVRKHYTCNQISMGPESENCNINVQQFKK